MAQLVKNPPAMRETWARFLGWEDPLEKGRLPTPIFWPEEFHGLYSPWGCKESGTTERLSLSLVAQMVKNLPAMQETWVRSLGWEDLREKGMAI